MRLHQKVALITGGTSGIGLATDEILGQSATRLLTVWGSR